MEDESRSIHGWMICRYVAAQEALFSAEMTRSWGGDAPGKSVRWHLDVLAGAGVAILDDKMEAVKKRRTEGQKGLRSPKFWSPHTGPDCLNVQISWIKCSQGL